MWPFLLVGSTPSLQLFDGIRKGQEPVRVQAHCAEAAVEDEAGSNAPRQDEHIIRRLAGPGEVEGDAALTGPEVHVARHELTALINADGLGIARLPTDPVQGRHNIFAPVAELRIQNRHVSCEKVSTTVNTCNFLPVAS